MGCLLVFPRRERNVYHYSPTLGRPLRELGIPDDCILPLVIREGKEAIIPYGDTVLKAGDQVIAVTSEASEETMRRILLG